MNIAIGTLGRSPSSAMMNQVFSILLIGMIVVFILVLLYLLSLRCTFDENRINFNKLLNQYNIDFSKGELLGIYIENQNASYPYYKGITDNNNFENKGIMENRGLYAPDTWHVVFVKKDSLRHKKTTFIHPANNDYIALEFRKEIIPLLNKLLPYCKTQRKREN